MDKSSRLTNIGKFFNWKKIKDTICCCIKNNEETFMDLQREYKDIFNLDVYLDVDENIILSYSASNLTK